MCQKGTEWKKTGMQLGVYTWIYIAGYTRGCKNIFKYIYIFE